MATTYLSRTFGSAGNQKTWTWSGWIKRSNLTSFQAFFANNSGGGIRGYFAFYNDTFYTYNQYNSIDVLEAQSSSVYRDTSGWYHIVVKCDTTQATSSDRFKVYINGDEISLTFTTTPSQNADLPINDNGIHYISSEDGSSSMFNGSMAHVYFIDGTAYDASTFGETDATTGIWKPKFGPSVTYGTNGFFLKFENSGAFGTDSSGNTNNFTVNGTMTQTIDTPSNVFATLNPLGKITTTSTGSATFSNGNLTATDSGVEARNFCTLGVSVNTNGKWYYEAKYTSSTQVRGYSVGWATDSCLYFGTFAEAGSFILKSPTGETYNGSWTSNGNTLSSGDILGVALDLENSEIKFYKNGVLDSTVSSISFVGDFIFPAIQWGVNPTSNGVLDFNFGNGYFGTTAVSSAQNPDDGIGIFEYAVPTGYKALCTKSINAQEYD